MTTTDQQILDAAKARLLAILSGGVAEYREGNGGARLLELKELRATISDYEVELAVAGRSYGAFPILPVDV